MIKYFCKIVLFFCLLCIMLAGASCSTQKKVIGYNTKYEIDVSRIGSVDKKLCEEVESWLGVPYKYGGESKQGIDCSALVVEIYKKVYGKKLYRNSHDIYKKNCRHINKKELKEGDLVFFITAKNRKRINHVGLYLNNNKFVHSTTKRGVIITDLSEDYYEKRFVGAGRVMSY